MRMVSVAHCSFPWILSTKGWLLVVSHLLFLLQQFCGCDGFVPFPRCLKCPSKSNKQPELVKLSGSTIIRTIRQQLQMHRFPIKRRQRPIVVAIGDRSCTLLRVASLEQSAEVQKRTELAELFCNYLKNSIQEGTFRSFTLYGPSSRKKNKRKAQSQVIDENIQDGADKNEELRGCFKRISGRNIQLERKRELMVQVTFKYHLATDSVKNWPTSTVAAYIRSLFMLEDNEGVQEDKRTAAGAQGVPKLASSEWGEQIHPIGSPLGIQKAILETNDSIWELDVSRQVSRPRLKQKAPSGGMVAGPISLSHDRIKEVPVATSSEFLQALGVTNVNGKPRPGKASKLRQIQKFVEITSGLIDKAMNQQENGDDEVEENSGKPGKQTILVVDAGCGRGEK